MDDIARLRAEKDMAWEAVQEATMRVCGETGPRHVPMITWHEYRHNPSLRQFEVIRFRWWQAREALRNALAERSWGL